MNDAIDKTPGNLGRQNYQQESEPIKSPASTLIAALTVPFPAEIIKQIPQAGGNDKSGIYLGVTLSVVDQSHYIKRLNDVFGCSWECSFEFVKLNAAANNADVIRCEVRVATPTGSCWRQNVAEVNSTSVKSTATDAFKRACLMFGLGAHLYESPPKSVLMFKNESGQRKIVRGGLIPDMSASASEVEAKDYAAKIDAVARIIHANENYDLINVLRDEQRDNLNVIGLKSKTLALWIETKLTHYSAPQQKGE